MVPVFPRHDAKCEIERGEGSVEVGAAERDVFSRAEVGKDDHTHEGVGEDDEEEDAHERDGANEGTHHRDCQVLHDALYECVRMCACVCACVSSS